MNYESFGKRMEAFSKELKRLEEMKPSREISKLDKEIRTLKVLKAIKHDIELVLKPEKKRIKDLVLKIISNDSWQRKDGKGLIDLVQINFNKLINYLP